MLLDLEGNIRFINRTAPGLTVAGVLGTSVYDYASPEAAAVARACYERVIASGEPDYYETPYVDDAGVTYIWEARVSAVRRGGKVEGLVVIATDVTERRAAQVDRDRFFDLSVDILIVIGPDNHARRVNAAATRILGWSTAEISAQSLLDLIHPDDMAATREQHARLARGERVIDFQNRWRSKDGDYRTIEWRAVVDDQTEHVHAVGRDVTEQRLIAEQLQQTQKMEVVGHLAGGVAHDFNNLMLALSVNAEFLDELLPRSDPRARTYLAEIQRAAERAEALTTQLLAFSRQQPHDPRPLCLNDLLRDLSRLLKRLIPENIEIHLDCGDIGTVCGDKTQIEQIVVNLCVNARDAMPRGGHIRIETRETILDGPLVEGQPWARPGRYAQLSVIDTGAGMSDEVRAHAFEPFFTTKPTGQGTGLGLATVYGVVRKHEGLVRLSSAPDEGTTVEVYLPVLESAQQSKADGARAASTERQVILVAEDDAQVRSVVIHLLERAGYAVLAAADGHEALELLDQHGDRVALAILDVVMPGLSGPDTRTQILATYPDLPVVLTSGYSDPSRLAGAFPDHITVLNKPYRSDALLRVVRQAIAGDAG
ncbi:MAG: PAS domain S-box protein [Myxococcales bacterium]|nr:PAS domain S-box protein [Myxococcales bacterium]